MTATRCTASCPTARIENVYQLKILNKDEQRRVVRVTVDGLPGARVETAPAEPGARARRACWTSSPASASTAGAPGPAGAT